MTTQCEIEQAPDIESHDFIAAIAHPIGNMSELHKFGTEACTGGREREGPLVVHGPMADIMTLYESSPKNVEGASVPPSGPSALLSPFFALTRSSADLVHVAQVL